MKRIKITFIFLTLLISAIGLNSCFIVSSMANNYCTVKNGGIPADFGKYNSTLLCILSGSKGHDKYIKKHAAKRYGGNVEFAFLEDIEKGKLANKEKYRYLLNHHISFVEHSTYNVSTNRTSSYAIKTSGYFIYDRVNKKEYDAGFTSGMYGKILKAYFNNLEEMRLKNQPKI
jgi:hypothetical protein